MTFVLRGLVLLAPCLPVSNLIYQRYRLAMVVSAEAWYYCTQDATTAVTSMPICYSNLWGAARGMNSITHYVQKVFSGH